MQEFELRFRGGPVDGEMRMLPGVLGQDLPAAFMEFRDVVAEYGDTVHEVIYRYHRVGIKNAYAARSPWHYEYVGWSRGVRDRLPSG